MPDRCVHVQAGEAAQGKTGVTYAPGISTETAGTQGLCRHIASLPAPVGHSSCPGPCVPAGSYCLTLPGPRQSPRLNSSRPAYPSLP